MREFGNFLFSEWYFAWPMIGLSVVGLALVLWRMLLNMNARTNMNDFLPLFQKKLEKDGVEGALRFCRSRTDIIPRRLYVAGLETSKQGMAAMRRSMANAVELEIVPDLNFLLPTILAIAKIATMIGLLGTVLSMIGTFSKIQETIQKQQNLNKARSVRVEGAPKPEADEDSGDIAAHSGEIGLALFATALGLVTAIPLVFSHVLFKAWVTRFELRLKSAAQKLLLLMQNYKPVAGTGKVATGSAATV